MYVRRLCFANLSVFNHNFVMAIYFTSSSGHEAGSRSSLDMDDTSFSWNRRKRITLVHEFSRNNFPKYTIIFCSDELQRAVARILWSCSSSFLRIQQKGTKPTCTFYRAKIVARDNSYPFPVWETKFSRKRKNQDDTFHYSEYSTFD